ncbi:major facilitator superfamily MFS_1 [Sulfuricurvum kujiense DSM 16994]|uniref:Major facilitator superfamily MFS_1 n=1 Tax=Sulfuricurvum kujiense (strain ATCC BAA-921 / DSM 16994 / JCM 11577 / YK-1) TaxID=709032 RepID=E4TWB2_SULKY|nr:MFS transporter [Sulfuricurvum kujiense]ADR32728.1 major facilitator superfamily MFS_1 [Sulfuricurvum kujiense DSM 16994]
MISSAAPPLYASPNVAVLIASFYFFYFALIGVHIIFVPKILSEVGYSPMEIGIIFASAPLVRFAIPFLFLKGLRLSRKTFFTALALMGLSAAGFYGALEHFWPLLIVNIFFGIGIALILPYIEVIALEQIGRERYGRIRLFGSLGFIAVSLVLVRFLSTPYIGIGFLIAMALITLIFGAIIGKHPHSDSSSDCGSGDELCLFSIRNHIPLWIGFFLMQVSFGPFYNFFTIYTTAHGISLDTTVWLWSFGVIAEILMFYFQGPLLRGNLERLLQLTALITALRWTIVALFPDSTPLLFASQSLHAFSFALFHTTAITLLFELYSARRLSQQFFFGISYGLGGFIGAIGAGALYQYTPSLLFIGGAIGALGAALAFRLDKKLRF